jgi:hypothetical protein
LNPQDNELRRSRFEYCFFVASGNCFDGVRLLWANPRAAMQPVHELRGPGSIRKLTEPLKKVSRPIRVTIPFAKNANSKTPIRTPIPRN